MRKAIAKYRGGRKRKKAKAPTFLEAMVGGDQSLLPRTGIGSIAGGAPLKLTKTVIEAGQAYVDLCEDSPMVVRKMFGVGVALKVNIPTIEGLALHLGVNRKMLYEWEQKATDATGVYPVQEMALYKGISNILEQVRTKQAGRLINGGLSGLYNPVIAKLLLGKHGYAEEKNVQGNVNHTFSLTGMYEAASKKRAQEQALPTATT